MNNDDVACLMRWLCVVVTFPQVSPRCVSFMSEGEFVFLTRPAVCSGLLWSCLVDGGSVYSKESKEVKKAAVDVQSLTHLLQSYCFQLLSDNLKLRNMIIDGIFCSI